MKNSRLHDNANTILIKLFYFYFIGTNETAPISKFSFGTNETAPPHLYFTIRSLSVKSAFPVYILPNRVIFESTETVIFCPSKVTIFIGVTQTWR